MRVTLEDIAQRVGVSKTTVSRILNQKNFQVSEATRKKVLDAAKELDYHPNELARALKTSETRLIGMILSNLRNSFWSIVLEGVEETCNRSGYHLMISNSDENEELEKEYLKRFQLRGVDGILINPTGFNHELLSDLEQQKFPVVLVSRKVAGLNLPTVAMNNIEGASKAVEHLLDVGRRRIALISYVSNGISTWSERIEGYKRTLIERGYEQDELIISTIDKNGQSPVQEIMDLIRQSHPDAILCTNNLLTLQVMDALREMNIDVPDDIALVGYDETVWARHLNPPLTTVLQPAREMGKVAVETLIQMIKSKESSSRTIELPTDLIVRASTIVKH